MKTVTKIKSLALFEGEKKEMSAVLGDYATGFLIEMEDGRILMQCSTDPIYPFSELKPTDPAYEQMKLLLAD